MNAIMNHDDTPARVEAPRVDIFENADEFLVLADLPGVHPEELRVEYDRDIVKLDARRADTAYARSFRVRGVDPERIDAKLDNGVLSLHLPKSEAAKPRQIPIRAS